MTQAEALERIAVDPAVCGGKPCVRGHRIWVTLVLGMLAEGLTVDEILQAVPTSFVALRRIWVRQFGSLGHRYAERRRDIADPRKARRAIAS